MKHTLKLSVMILLVFALVLSIGMLTACGENEDTDDTTATEASADRGTAVQSGTCKDGLTWSLYENGELVLSGTPEEGAMYDYAKKNETPAWKAYSGEIRGITLDNSIKVIAEDAFSSLNNLIWVQFGKGVETIGVNAFRSCTNLRRIILPESVTTISKGAFDGCYRMYEARLNEGLTKIGEGAFNACRGLYSVTIPSTLKNSSVAADAFSGDKKIYEIITANTDVEGKNYGGVASNTSASISTESSLENNDGYITSGNRLVAYIGEATSVEVPSGVQVIAPYALYANTRMTSLKIADTVQLIDESAFENCTSLETLTIGAGVKNIVTDAFKNCNSVKTLNYNATSYTSSGSSDMFAGMTALTTINFGSGVTQLTADDGMFRNCTALKSVTLPAVKLIPKGMFEGCTALEEVVANGTITRLGENAFKNCTSLRKFDMTRLADGADIYTSCFEGCTGLVQIDLTKVDQIQDSAFRGCSGLTGLVTGTKLQVMGSSAFEGCVKLIDVVCNTGANWTPGSSSLGGIAKYTTAEIGIGKGTSRLKDVDGFLFLEASSGTNYLVGYQGTASTLTLPALYNNKAYTIYKGAFADNDKIVSVKMSAGITAMGEEAFQDCLNLRSVDFTGATITSIGAYTFDGCINLEIVTLVSSITEIGECAFRDTESLGEMSLVNVTTLGARAFQYSGVTKVTAGNGLTTILPDTFSGCERMTQASIPAAVTISNQAFANCYELVQINMPKAETIGEYAFYRNYALRSVELPAVVTIGQCAFEGCGGMLSLTLGENLKTIDNAAFRDCGKLVCVINQSKHLTLKTGEMGPGYVTRNAQIVASSADDSLKIQDGKYAYIVDGATALFLAYIGDEDVVTLPAKLGGKSYDIHRFAFYGSHVTEVTIPDGVLSIGSSAFAYSKLQKITLPASLQSIDASAFEGSDLISFTANEGLKTIGDAAFKSCKELRTVKLSNTVKTVGFAAFRYCSTLATIDLGTSLEKISDYMFDGCSNLHTLVVPKSVTSYGSRWYVGCEKLIEVIDLTNKLTYDKLSINNSLDYCTVRSIKNLVTSANLAAADENGFIFYSDGSGNNYLVAYVGTEKNVVLPASYKGGTYQIYQYAFYRNEIIETVKLSDKVTGIGAYAFAGCTNLKGLFIPTSVKGTFGVGECIFYGCNADLLVATGFASEAELPSTWSVEAELDKAWPVSGWNLQAPGAVYDVVYGITYDIFTGMLAN